ncbi:hypothetical protein ACLKA6_009732 [Drosophila palustris]
MYRCVRVAMPDSLYQCILWRDSPEEDIKVFKLDREISTSRPHSWIVMQSHKHSVSSKESSHRAPCTSGQDSTSVLANWRIKNCNQGDKRMCYVLPSETKLCGTDDGKSSKGASGSGSSVYGHWSRLLWAIFL